nr:mitochondrial outer membrane protein porin 2-like [Tanacetum cinerariifolium]
MVVWFGLVFANSVRLGFFRFFCSAPTGRADPGVVKNTGLFSDIGKKAKDLLTRDYLSDHKLSVSTTTDAGVHLRDYGSKKHTVDCVSNLTSSNTFLYLYTAPMSPLDWPPFFVAAE